MLQFLLLQAAVMAAEDMSLLPKGDGAGGLVGVLDVGGRSAQCSIIDTAGTAEVGLGGGLIDRSIRCTASVLCSVALAARASSVYCLF